MDRRLMGQYSVWMCDLYRKEHVALIRDPLLILVRHINGKDTKTKFKDSTHTAEQYCAEQIN